MAKRKKAATWHGVRNPHPATPTEQVMVAYALNWAVSTQPIKA